MKISLIQTAIEWEDKDCNLKQIEQKIAGLSGKTDMVVLPEMFTTGFSMNSKLLAEDNEGTTVSTIKRWSKDFDLAVCGSFIAKEGNDYYNRGFFISPTQATFYNKRHLFAMGGESKYFKQGQRQVIVEHKGFRVCLLVCYDLRFPVWSRNVDNSYDVLVYVANWPQARINVWKVLLKARAIENMAYVCGVNRVGNDATGLHYNGASALINYKGEEISSLENDKEQIETIEISLEKLTSFRAKFPAWKDADVFEIKG